MNKLVLDDSYEYLQSVEDNTIDCTVTDPPYGLSFMGKDWDKTVVPVKHWKEILRVMKAGAFAFIMSIPRQDILSRMIVNLQDAGFNTGFTSIYWVYACVSEDTEILTKDGFKTYDKISKGELIASLNVDSNKLEYQPINDILIYDIDGDMCNIKTKNTDQLVTLNHRVLLQSRTNSRYNYGGFEYREAHTLLNGRVMPFYKLPLAREYISGDSTIIKHKIVENKKWEQNFAELLGWIISDGGFTKGKNYEDIRIYQSSSKQECVNRIRYLLKITKIPFKEYSRNRVYKNRQYLMYDFVISDKTWINKIKDIIPNKKPTQNLLHCEPHILKGIFDGLIGGDGSKQGKNYAFYQKDPDTLHFMQILSTHLGYRTKLNVEKQTIQIGWRNSTEIQNRDNHISKVKYKGKVWSIRTKYSNYVARRNGMVFITGNTGFPKALNISKAIDKKLGSDLDVTISDLSKSKHFHGSYGGFQPKPAVEVILVAMKPLEEKTYVEQVLKNGKSITWLDNCRIPIPEGDIENYDYNRRGSYERAINPRPIHEGGFKPLNPEDLPQMTGRFPTNLIVSDDALNDGRLHDSGSDILGNRYGSFSRYFDLDLWWTEKIKELPHEVQKTHPFWLVPKASKIEKDKGCENVTSIGRRFEAGEALSSKSNSTTRLIKGNYHPTVKPVRLMAYLITMGSQVGDLILDPFLGSGTTVLAAQMLKRRYLGIERDHGYYTIARHRTGLTKRNVKRLFRSKKQ